jgi:hypothetical protein
LRRLSLSGSSEAQLADFYDSIFQVASPRSEEMVERLRQISPARLSPLEVKLRDAALSVAQQIHDSAKPSDENTVIPEHVLESSLENRVEQSLSIVDELIGGVH